MAITETDLAYVAGVVDLVANIKIRRAGQGTNVDLPVIAIYGAYPDVLHWLGEHTETRPVVTSRQYARAGCQEHCQEKHQHVTSVSARWSLTGAKATIVLYNVMPYLKFQTHDAEMAVQLGLITNYKQATVTKMRSLGWETPPEMSRTRRRTA